MKQPKIALLGGGTHGVAMVETLLLNHAPEDIIVYDDNPELEGTTIFGVKIKGKIEIDPLPEMVNVAIGDNRLRKSLSEAVLASGRQLISIADSRIFVSRSAKIDVGLGAYVGAKVFSEVEIGKGLVLGDSLVDRRSKVGDWVRIAHGIMMGPNVCIGDGVEVGTGAVIKGGVSIGAWAVIGAGAVVIHDVAPGDIVAGVPARSTAEIRTQRSAEI